MSNWKRFLAVSCSHGPLADRASVDLVMRFAMRFRPHTCVHLGDFIDATAFMGSATDGTRESAADVGFDLVTGLRFLGDLMDASGAQRRVILCGNHEDRLWRLTRSPRAVVAHAARCCTEAIENVASVHRAELVPWTGNAQCVMLGDKVRLMHGTIYNEMAARDMAEAFAPAGGCVIFGHTHRAFDATGRRADAPRAINAGCLVDVSAMEYAKARRATLAWRNAIVYGEYNETAYSATLHQRASDGAWRMP